MLLSELDENKDIFLVIENCRLNGKYINENSLDYKITSAYNFILNNKKVVSGFFSLLGYKLVSDTGYYYFTLEEYEHIPNSFTVQYLDYIDIYRFLKTLDSDFSSENDYKFNISSLEDKLNKDIELKTMSEKMSFIKKKKTNREFIESLLKRLKDDGFVESFNNKESEFLLLKSFKHIETTILGVEDEL